MDSTAKSELGTENTGTWLSLRSRLGGYGPVADYVLRRFGVYIFTVWGAITLSFFVFRLMPGDPMRIVFAQFQEQTGQAIGTREMAEAYKKLFGLDKPLFIQYFLYLRNVFIGGFDLGPSFIAFPTKARDLVLRQLPWTLSYFTTSMLIAWAIGTGLGALMGWMRRRRLSSIAVVISTLLTITPVYIMAIALIIFVGYQLKLLPPGQPYDPGMTPSWSWEFIRSLLRHAIMPMASMVLVWGASFTIGMRSLMISVLGEDFLIYARAKGLAPATILKDYAFRNALLPQVVGLGIALGATLNGALIIEALFLLPGLGGLFVRAMGIRDFNVMQGVVLISSIAVLTLGLIVDLILPLLDPRIRRSNA